MSCRSTELSAKKHPAGCFFLERMTGIEPASPAWEAEALPLDDIRIIMLCIVLYTRSVDYASEKCLSQRWSL